MNGLGIDSFFIQDDVSGMLSYTFKVCHSLIQNRQFRKTVLTSLVNLYRNLAVPDYISVCQVPTIWYYILHIIALHKLNIFC